MTSRCERCGTNALNANAELDENCAPFRRNGIELDSERRMHVVAPRAPLQIDGWPGYHWYLVPRVGYPDPAYVARERPAVPLDELRATR